MNEQSRPPQAEPPKTGRGEGAGKDQPRKKDHESIRERMLDKTLADSFPTSDPPSSIPDPCEDDSFAA